MVHLATPYFAGARLSVFDALKKLTDRSFQQAARERERQETIPRSLGMHKYFIASGTFLRESRSSPIEAFGGSALRVVCVVFLRDDGPPKKTGQAEG